LKPHESTWNHDDMVVLFTALLGITLPGIMYVVYSYLHKYWYLRRANQKQETVVNDTNDVNNDEIHEDVFNEPNEQQLLLPTLNVYYASQTGNAKVTHLFINKTTFSIYRNVQSVYAQYSAIHTL
jgi:hypothetical protein